MNRLMTKVSEAATKDPELLSDRNQVTEVFGHNPDYLFDVFGITKSDLIRLSRKGLAVKAHYQTKAGNRVRWILFKEILNGSV